MGIGLAVSYKTGVKVAKNVKLILTTPNLTPTWTLKNLKPRDPVWLETPPRTLEVDSTGRYWLKEKNGTKITPTGSYDYVTMPNGEIRLAKANSSVDYSTHLGLSKGGEVQYAGTIHFGSKNSSNKARILEWTNDSGHYKPPSGLADRAGFPLAQFVPVNEGKR